MSRTFSSLEVRRRGTRVRVDHRERMPVEGEDRAGEAALGGELEGTADHRAVPRVYAVERPERERARARGQRRDVGDDLHQSLTSSFRALPSSAWPVDGDELAAEREADRLLGAAGQAGRRCARPSPGRPELDAGHELQRHGRRVEAGDVLVTGPSLRDGLFELGQGLRLVESQVAHRGARRCSR